MEFGLHIDPPSAADKPSDPEQLAQPHGERPWLRVSHSDEAAHTLLVIDPDTDDRQELLKFGDQFMVRIRSAANLEEGKQLTQTPSMSGVLLSTQAVPSGSSLREAIEELRAQSPLSPLPIAVIDEPGQTPDRIRALWAGASILLSKPLTAHTFGRALRRLISHCQAQKSTILVIEPTRQFSACLGEYLDLTTTTVHSENSPTLIFDSLERWSPDLLVMHTDPVGPSTFDICRTLRAMPRWQDMPIVMVSEQEQADLRLAAYEAGADDFITQTIDGPELKARIQVRLQRARMLKERADYDPLTGLQTRRAFLEQLAIRLSEAARHHRPLAFCLLDVDRFKQVNDQYGHLVGDRVLDGLGRLLRSRFRIEDLRARWGGEEFAVVLIDEGVDTAQMALGRLLDEFSQIAFTDESGRPFHVTFSAGVAQFPTDGADAESLVAAADDRLLQAKRAGRNRIYTDASTAKAPL